MPVRRPSTPGAAVGGFICSLLWGMGVLSLLGLALSIAGYRAATKIGAPTGLAIWGIVLGALGAFTGIPLLISMISAFAS